MKSPIMKNVLTLLSILLSISAALADRLYIDPFEISGGETKDVSICLENNQAISAFQTDINLSTGLEIVKQGEDWMVLASRASSDHSLVVNTEGLEIVRLVCFSNTNTSFSGNEGAVVTLRIKADEGFEGGWISLTNIKLSDSSNHDIILESSDAYVTGIVAPQTITISEGSVDLKVGQEYGLTANVYPDNTTDRTIIWTSDNESVVTVDSNGYLRAMSQGSATITATCGNVSATCAVTVSAREVESVVLSNTEVELKVGGIINLTADVYPEDAIDKTVTWSSDNDAVATVDAGGSVTAISPGTAAITAICGNVTAACVVTVIATPVESVTLSQTTAELKVGGSLVLTATVLPEEATDKTVKWSSDNETVATVDGNGNVTAVSLGTATISANSGNYSASCVVTVIATPVESVTLSQTTAELKVGGSVSLTAEVLPMEATDRTVVWTSDDEAVATVDGNGNVTAISLGTATVSARSGDVSASCVVTVIATPVESVTLSQTTAELKVGESVSLTAEVLPIEATDRTVVWTSDDEAVATVDGNGNVTAISLGTAIISARSGDVTASCVVTVIATPVESVTLSQTTAELKVGGSVSLTAEVLPIEATDRTVVWTSDNESVATVDGNGNVTAVSPGTATITATCGSVSASCVVTVDPVQVESILLSTTNWSGEEGEAFHIDATVLPEDATDKSLVWTTTDETIATVDSEGNVSVLKEGSCVIRATAADGSGVLAECMITSTTGVEGIFTDSEDLDIYDFNGLLIKNACGLESLKNLTPGIYIIRQGSAMKKLVIR